MRGPGVNGWRPHFERHPHSDSEHSEREAISAFPHQRARLQARLLLISLLIAACALAQEGRGRPAPFDQARASAPGRAPAGEAYSFLPEDGDLSGVADLTVLIPQPTSEPLRLAFPTLALQVELIRRPPPYPAPWSLRPEDHFWLSRPLASDQANWPLPDYRYGATYFGMLQVHAGVDMDAPVGTPVLAAASGKVVWAGWGVLSRNPALEDAYGLAVAIEHPYGLSGKRLYTLYAHLSRVTVLPDEWVATGQTIGEVGLTGFTTGDHLHFEVRHGANAYANTRNPELWLAPPQGWGVLAGRITDDSGYPLYGKLVRIQSVESGQRWVVYTYASDAVHSDDIYRENFVISDLPAGEYAVSLDYTSWRQGWKRHEGTVTVFPGATTVVAFQPDTGLTVERRPDPLPLPPGPPPSPGK